MPRPEVKEIAQINRFSFIVSCGQELVLPSQVISHVQAKPWPCRVFLLGAVLKRKNGSKRKMNCISLVSLAYLWSSAFLLLMCKWWRCWHWENKCSRSWTWAPICPTWPKPISRQHRLTGSTSDSKPFVPVITSPFQRNLEALPLCVCCKLKRWCLKSPTVSHNCFYCTSKPECAIPDDNEISHNPMSSLHSWDSSLNPPRVGGGSLCM